MTGPLWISLALAAWAVVPFPLAVLVGRALRSAGATVPAAPVTASPI